MANRNRPNQADPQTRDNLSTRNRVGSIHIADYPTQRSIFIQAQVKQPTSHLRQHWSVPVGAGDAVVRYTGSSTATADSIFAFESAAKFGEHYHSYHYLTLTENYSGEGQDDVFSELPIA